MDDAEEDADEDEWEEELIPGEQEAEDRGRRDAGDTAEDCACVPRLRAEGDGKHSCEGRGGCACRAAASATTERKVIAISFAPRRKAPASGTRQRRKALAADSTGTPFSRTSATVSSSSITRSQGLPSWSKDRRATQSRATIQRRSSSFRPQ